MRVFLTLLGLICQLLPETVSATCQPVRERFALQLKGTASRAEILMPPAEKPLALMVLIHGSDVADLDGSVVGSADEIISTPLKDVAVAMACAGIATVRYDKRFVTGATTVDREKFGKATLQDFLGDAETALQAAKGHGRLQTVPELAFGWSEGTTVAAALAIKRPEIQGLILQAPVMTSFAEKLPLDFPRVGAPYLRRYAKDGEVDAEAIARAASGPGGVIAKIYVRMFKGFAPNETINPLLDTNKDGRINIDKEAAPIIAAWFADNANGGLGIYASTVALPGIRSQLAFIKSPVLILQGESDGAISDADALRLRDERLPNINVKIYPGLGHTLGPSTSPIEDRFLPISTVPLNDMVQWAVTIARKVSVEPNLNDHVKMRITPTPLSLHD